MRKKSLYNSVTNRKKWRKIFSYFLWFLGGTFFLRTIFCVHWVYVNVFKDIPVISSTGLQNLTFFSQSSVITDRNGAELYRLFEQNREIVSYENISSHMVHAIVSAEDKTFRTNNGLDIRGIIRAVRDNVITRLGIQDRGTPGGSTITQQVVKDLLLDRGKFVARKIKEWVLVYDLHDAIDTYLRNRYGKNLSTKELKKKRKQMVMEIYLNMGFLGNNAYGVEAAAQTYFKKSAKDLNILESAILAGIVQAPGRYNPYSNRIGKDSPSCSKEKWQVEECQGAIGGLSVKNKGKEIEISGNIQEYIFKKIEPLLLGPDLTKSSQNASFISFLEGKKEVDISYNGKIYTITYKRGRKDTVLFRMYEQGFISAKEVQQAVFDGLTLVLHTKAVAIKAPHFIFWVRDFILEGEDFKKLQIDEDVLLKGGLTIKTTLDYDMQKIAEKAIIDNNKDLKDRGGNNRALLYLDSKNGDVLAYVGSLDYNNKEIDGNVDMIRSEQRHPGSSIKPFVYAYGFQTTPLTIDTPIFDIPMNIGGLQPNNVDMEFHGIVPLRQGLAGSRNIPAIKTYFAVGEQDNLIPFLKNIGLTSLRDKHDYGYSLSLGAVEMPMLQMAQAYAHLSTLGKPARINPILEIRGPDGNIIYRKEPDILKRVIEAGPAYLIRKILSEDANLPPGWASSLRMRGFKSAAKSGTSNYRDPKTNESMPRDGRVILYTPSKVVVTWAGNTKGTPMGSKALSVSLNGPVLKDFFGKLVEKGYMLQEDHKPVDVAYVSINKVSGKLASPATPKDFVVSTLGYNKTLPAEGDGGMTPFLYDPLCGGSVSEFTPESEQKQGYVISPVSFIPNQRDIKDIIAWWNAGNHSLSGDEQFLLRKSRVTYNYPNIFVEQPVRPCEERIPKEDLTIKVGVSSPEDGQYVGSSFSLRYSVVAQKQGIKTVKVFIDGEPAGGKVYGDSSKQKIFSDTVDVVFPQNLRQEGKHVLAFTVIDGMGYANSVTKNISLTTDTVGPLLDVGDIKVISAGSGYKITLSFFDEFSSVSQGKILIHKDAPAVSFKGDFVSFSLEQLQSIGYVVSDSNGNETRDVLDLTPYDPLFSGYTTE